MSYPEKNYAPVILAIARITGACEKVRAIVGKIPQGKTMTYKQVAAKAGNPHAARAVGAIMRTNYDPAIPCHRVIKSDGSMGGYNRGGATAKKRLLARESKQIS
ncbi:MGMT family protein [Candidatus Kaiserbacteria bacterium]|nr:MGMT family protein [Candidatus Kaiserbacteria bacterium]